MRRSGVRKQTILLRRMLAIHNVCFECFHADFVITVTIVMCGCGRQSETLVAALTLVNSINGYAP